MSAFFNIAVMQGHFDAVAYYVGAAVLALYAYKAARAFVYFGPVGMLCCTSNVKKYGEWASKFLPPSVQPFLLSRWPSSRARARTLASRLHVSTTRVVPAAAPCVDCAASSALDGA